MMADLMHAFRRGFNEGWTLFWSPFAWLARAWRRRQAKDQSPRV
jgi:hypothetical protein